MRPVTKVTVKRSRSESIFDIGDRAGRHTGQRRGCPPVRPSPAFLTIPVPALGSLRRDPRRDTLDRRTLVQSVLLKSQHFLFSLKGGAGSKMLNACVLKTGASLRNAKRPVLVGRSNRSAQYCSWG